MTAALGTLYAAIYFRGGNLWVLVFLHTMQDVAALIGFGPVREHGLHQRGGQQL